MVALQDFSLSNFVDIKSSKEKEFQLAKEQFNFLKEIKQVVKTLAYMIGEKELKIKVENKSSRETIFGDSSRFQQVVVNFLDNSIRHQQKGVIYVQFKDFK